MMPIEMDKGLIGANLVSLPNTGIMKYTEVGRALCLTQDWSVEFIVLINEREGLILRNLQISKIVYTFGQFLSIFRDF